MTKRQAIAAMGSFILVYISESKAAEKKLSTTGLLNEALKTATLKQDFFVKLDNINELRVEFKGAIVSITPEEIMKALKGDQ